MVGINRLSFMRLFKHVSCWMAFTTLSQGRMGKFIVEVLLCQFRRATERLYILIATQAFFRSFSYLSVARSCFRYLSAFDDISHSPINYTGFDYPLR